MDSKNKIITEISVVIAGLSLKLEPLQAKVKKRCRATGACRHIKQANKELIPQKEVENGINLDTLRKKE